jgi:hypothetical protein
MAPIPYWPDQQSDAESREPHLTITFQHLRESMNYIADEYPKMIWIPEELDENKIRQIQPRLKAVIKCLQKVVKTMDVYLASSRSTTTTSSSTTPSDVT